MGEEGQEALGNGQAKEYLTSDTLLIHLQYAYNNSKNQHYNKIRSERLT